MSRFRWFSSDGFTLIELLASLAVLSMLSLMLVAGIGGRSIAWTRMDRGTASGEAVEAVQAVLHERVQHIWPVTTYDFLQPRPDFKGDATRMEFLAPPPQARGLAPLRRYQLTLDAGGDLTLNSLSDIALDRLHWSERQILMRGVQAVDIGYFGAEAPNQPATWQGAWTQQSAMPALVRIRVAFPDGDRRRWPDLIVHPMIDIDTDCVVASTGGCNGR